MKKLIPLLLTAVLFTALTSCGKTEEIITIYNASDYYIDCIAIAPEPDVFTSEDAILFFDYELDYTSRLDPKTAIEGNFEVPADLADETWYIYVSGSYEEFIDMYEQVIEAGAIFADGTWGFQIDFDSEAGNFDITLLGDSDI